MKRALKVVATLLATSSLVVAGAAAATATEIPSGLGCVYGKQNRTTIQIYGSNIVHMHRFNATLVEGTRYNYNAAPAYDPYVTVATLGMQSTTSTGYRGGQYISVTYNYVTCV